MLRISLPCVAKAEVVHQNSLQLITRSSFADIPFIQNINAEAVIRKIFGEFLPHGDFVTDL